MWRTVVSQRYERNVAVDTSGFSNNGIPIAVAPASPGFAFDQAASRINILTSPTLQNLGAIQTSVEFALVPNGPHRRWNLCEGFESFSVFVNADLSVQATILDASSNWAGATSIPNAVTPNVRHVVVATHDGVNSIRVFLDGTLVAQSDGVAGPVRSVGSLGIAVGHWPNPGNQYTFEGTIYRYVLLRYDLASDLKGLLDPCCVRWKDLLRLLARVERRAGADGLSALGQRLLHAATHAEAKIRSGSEDLTIRRQKLAVQLLASLRRRNLTELQAVLSGAAAATAGEMTKARELQDPSKVLAEFGFTAAEWLEILDLLCLNPRSLAKGGSCSGN